MAIAAIALTSCKKEEVESTQLGEATINGNIYADLDYTNDVDAAGLYDQGLVNENVEGLTVTVEVDTKNWDQTPDNSYTYAKKTYTATTDASGNYSLVIPATDKAFNVTVNLGYIFTTRKDFAVDGVTVLEENVRVGGNSFNKSIYSGAVITASDAASVSYVDGGTEEYGSAIVRVRVNANWDQGPNSTDFYDDLTGSSVIGKTVELTYENAPYGNGTTNVWTGVVDASGIVEFTVPTYALGSASGVRVKAKILDFTGTYLYDDGGTEASQDAIWETPYGYSGFFSNGDITTMNIYCSFTDL
jgi:hypothetical protein